MRRATLLLATLLTVALPLSAQAAGGKTAALTTPWGQARTLHTPDGKQLVVSTKGGPGVATHHVVEHSGGQLYLSPVRSIHTPFGPSDVVVARGKLGHSILINGKRYAIADVDGAFVYRDSKGQRHTGAIRDGNNLVFPEGVAKQVETYEGTQHVLVTEQWGQPLYQKVSFENGTMSLVALEPIGTQYGQATLGMKGNILEQRIEIDGHSFKLSTNKQGLPVFTDGSGKSYTSFARSGRSILTGRGATTRGQYNGKAVDLLQTTDYYGAPSWQRVTQEDGQLQFESIDVLQTPYGATTLGKHGTAFEQRLDVGKDSFLVLDKGNGKLAYVGADGVEQTGVIHHGASLLTPSGLTKTVQLHGKPVEIL